MSSVIAKLCFFHGSRRQGGGASTPDTILGADLHRWFKGDGTLWQDSGRTTPATSDGDPVGAWDDASGNGGHATQGTAGARPTPQTAELNALAVVRGDGTDDFLSGAITADASTTVWIVAKHGGTAGNAAPWSREDFNTQLYTAGSGGVWRYFTPDTDMGGASSGWTRLCVRFNSNASADLYRDGTSIGNINPDDASATNTTRELFASGGGAGNFFGGDIAEVIEASVAASAQQLTDIDAYLVAKYGL